MWAHGAEQRGACFGPPSRGTRAWTRESVFRNSVAEASSSGEGLARDRCACGTGAVRAGLAALQMRGFRYPELCRAQLDRRLRRGSRQTPEDRLHAHECCGSPVHPGAGPILLDIRAASDRYHCCNCCCCSRKPLCCLPADRGRASCAPASLRPQDEPRPWRLDADGLCDGGVVMCEAGGRC